MMTKRVSCPEKRELLKKVTDALSKLENLAKDCQEAIRADDERRVAELDEELEHALGEKERALGAYRLHVAEHECSSRKGAGS